MATSSQQHNGRYTRGGVTSTVDGMTGWWDRSILYRSDDDTIIELSSKYDRRADLLSSDVYGTPGYAWAILQYNNILDPVMEFRTGKTIRLPSGEKILFRFT